MDSSIPMEPISFIRPTARPTPAPTPRIEPNTPSSSASSSTERLTCLRLEPMARIRPISRVRWATSIENVLMIRKMPTRKAIPAKPSIAYFITSRKEPTSERLASAASFAVCSLYGPAPSAAATFCLSCASLTPLAAVTFTAVNWPVAPRSSRCAVAVSK